MVQWLKSRVLPHRRAWGQLPLSALAVGAVLAGAASPASAQSDAAAVTRDTVQSATFEGGELRRSLLGRWVLRTDDGRCSIYRLWSQDDRWFSIWNEEEDRLLSLDIRQMNLAIWGAAGDAEAEPETRPLTAVSSVRNPNPRQDCTNPAERLNAENWQEEGADPFPLDNFGYDSGLFSRQDNGQWRQLPGYNNRTVSGTQEITYDVVDVSADRLILYNEEFGLHALVELRYRSLSLFTMNGVVGQFYPITTTSPAYGWAVASQRRDMTASDMVTADYDGGRLALVGAGRWLDQPDGERCSYYQEWNRNFTTIRLHAATGARAEYPRIEIDVPTMTARYYQGYGPGEPVAETRQLTGTSYAPIEGDPFARCNSTQQ